MKKKLLNILMVCKSLPDTYAGGIQTHVWALSEALLRLGHRVTLLSGGAFHKPLQEEWIEGRRVLRLPYFPGRRLPLVARTADELAFNLAVDQWLLRHGAEFDVVHLQGRSGGLVSNRSLRIIPGVVTYHGLHRYERIPTQSLDNYLRDRLSRQLERNPLERCRARICVSDAMAEMVRSTYGSNHALEIIPNGIREMEVPTGTVNYRKVVFVGRLFPIKRLDVLMDAVPFLRPDLEVEIIGDGPLRPSLQAQIDQHDWQQVRLLGSLPQAEVYRRMAEALVMVLPSEMESQGIVLMEANYCGRPVICTDIPGTSGVVLHEYNGLRVPVGDAQKLAEGINRLYENPQLADAMGRNGRKHVLETYNWKAIAQQTESVYYQILRDAA